MVRLCKQYKVDDFVQLFSSCPMMASKCRLKTKVTKETEFYFSVCYFVWRALSSLQYFTVVDKAQFQYFRKGVSPSRLVYIAKYS